MSATCLLAALDAARGAWWPDSWVGRAWVLFGFAAQFVFAGRFIVQWIASERKGRSHVPLIFWYLSLVGGVMLFFYFSFWKRDMVGVAGQSTGIVVYVRNLMLLRKEKRALQAAKASETATT